MNDQGFFLIEVPTRYRLLKPLEGQPIPLAPDPSFGYSISKKTVRGGHSIEKNLSPDAHSPAPINANGNHTHQVSYTIPDDIFSRTDLPLFFRVEAAMVYALVSNVELPHRRVLPI